MARPEPSAPAGPAVPMAGYPLEWESDVVLADGGTVRVRPIRPDDDDRLLRLYEQVSDETIYLRFFSPVSRPTARRLDRLTEVDHVDHVVLVAELGDDLVAVARYDRMARTDDAEVAFTVRDDQQGRGIGTIMLEHLAVIAREHGIGRFVATTLPRTAGCSTCSATPGSRSRGRSPRASSRWRSRSRPPRRRWRPSGSGSTGPRPPRRPDSSRRARSRSSARTGSAGRSATRSSGTCSRATSTGPSTR
ncbi:MAG: GNAT family N-acetyltransferase [Acidimicrobiia bacterium]|nr:GNAT family N-acetyltransferase [Acidimicrobiia bacterium]